MFKNFKNNVVTHNTTIINGKIVSSDDPRVAETMEKMQKKFGKYMNNNMFANMIQNTDSDADLSEVQEELADLARSGFMPGFNTEMFSMQTGDEKKEVQCKNCGANNTITYGTHAECEYCGSGLSY